MEDKDDKKLKGKIIQVFENFKQGFYNQKENDKMTIGDYVSLAFIVIFAIVGRGFIIGFFILCIKALFEIPSSGEINFSNPANVRRMGKIIIGIIAIVLFVCIKE